MDQPLNRITVLLEDLAKKLGVTVEHLWPLLIAKTQIDYIFESLSIFLGLAIAGLLVMYFHKLYNRDDDWGPGVIITGVLFGLLLIALLIQISTIGTLIYPEAAVIEKLIGGRCK